VRSGCVSTRSHRRNDRDGRPTTARDRPLSSQGQAATMSTLWSLSLSGQAVSADAARLGTSRPLVSTRSRCHLFATLLDAMAEGLPGRPVGSGATGPSVPPPRDRSGGAARGRGRRALPPSALALVARPSRLCALCDQAKLGRGGGEKRRRRAWRPTSLTGRWRIFRALWPPMHWMMVPSACCPQSIIAATSGSALTSWITIPPTRIAGPFAGVGTRL
jgi:hypothetical protein